MAVTKAVEYPDCSYKLNLVGPSSLRYHPKECMCSYLGKGGFLEILKYLNSYNVLKTCNTAGNLGTDCLVFKLCKRPCGIFGHIAQKEKNLRTREEKHLTQGSRVELGFLET